MNTKIYERSLPLLAAALSDSRGVKVAIGGSGAFTDGHVVHIPSYPLDADEKLLGAARAALDHESGHVLYSEFSVLKRSSLTPLEKFFANVVEDVRVEALMAERYPGCAQNFRSGAKYMFIDKGAPTTDPVCAVPNYVLYRLRAKTCPELEAKERETGNLIAQTFPGLLTKMERIFADINASCPDTAASIEYGRRFAALLKDYASAPDADGDGNSAADHNGNAPDANGNTSGEETHDVIDNASGSSDASASLDPLFGPDAESILPKGLGEALAEELESKTPKTGSAMMNAIQTALEVPTPKDFTPMNQAMLERTYVLQANLRPLLRGSLLAETLEGSMPATQGRLNSRKLYSVPLGNQHVFTRRVPARLTATALHILIDRSGSTGRIARESAISAYAVAHAAAGIRGVTVGMAAFPCDYDQDTNQPGVCTLLKHGQLSPRYLDFGADGSTPFSEAVYHVIPVLMKQRTYRRILLIFTDGRPDSVETAKAALHDAAALGIECYGVSFKSDAIIDLLGADRSVVIQQIDELPHALANMLLSALRKAA